jgi:uncharacterized damage-inducible protein DinB
MILNDTEEETTMHKKSASGFADTYADYEANGLISVFAAGPARLRAAIAGLGSDAMTAHPRPGKWSIKEIVPHVTDSEVQGTFRIKMVLAQPGEVWPVYDQDAWVREHAYQAFSAAELESSLLLFEALRAAITPLFSRARDKDWSRDGVHPELGPMTLRNLLELYADHSERHIGQILEMRTMLGQPLEMPLLLERRLY